MPNENNNSSNLPEFTREGRVYFDTDNKKIYIETSDSDENVNSRVLLYPNILTSISASTGGGNAVTDLTVGNNGQILVTKGQSFLL